jgi:hypothetical protein
MKIGQASALVYENKQEVDLQNEENNFHSNRYDEEKAPILVKLEVKHLVSCSLEARRRCTA